MKPKLRVHVATLDHHVERIIEPLISLHADKAYIIAFKEKDDSHEFLKKTKAILAKQRIAVSVEFVDIWNLMKCVSLFRDIIAKENENHLFFNVSTGTKISCISAMLACMIWNCEPYYAKPEYQDIKIPKKIKSEKIREIVSIPTYNMSIPKPEYLDVLSILLQNNGKMKKRHLIEELKKMRIIFPGEGSSLSKPAEHGQLKTILDPMLNSEYITIDSIGRNSIVCITEQGKNTLIIFRK